MDYRTFLTHHFEIFFGSHHPCYRPSSSCLHANKSTKLKVKLTIHVVKSDLMVCVECMYCVPTEWLDVTTQVTNLCNVIGMRLPIPTKKTCWTYIPEQKKWIIIYKFCSTTNKTTAGSNVKIWKWFQLSRTFCIIWNQNEFPWIISKEVTSTGQYVNTWGYRLLSSTINIYCTGS